MHFCSQPKSKKYAFSQGKMHDAGKLNHKTCIIPTKYAFSAASRKAKQYAFFHGKMHNSGIFFGTIKMHNSVKTVVWTKPTKYAFSAACRKTTNKHFPMVQCIFLEKSWSHQKCILKMRVAQKCILNMHIFACSFYGHSKMHTGFWQANFPDLHGHSKSRPFLS